MRRSIVLLAGLLATVLVVGSLPAAAYVDVGYDPQDSDTYDIRSTLRRVQRGKEARFLKIVVRTYGEDLGPGGWVSIDALLDAKKGRAADAILHMWIADMSGSGCELTKRAGGVLKVGHLRVAGSDHSAIACRVRTHRLHPDKAVRWRITITSLDGGPAYDVAPDSGMYG